MLDRTEGQVKILNIACGHDAQTEVLTNAGWKQLFSEVTGDEALATVDPATAALLYTRPMRLTRHPYSGPMIRGVHRYVDFCVTPDHTLFVRRWEALYKFHGQCRINVERSQ